jgi:hypothetical protein
VLRDYLLAIAFVLGVSAWIGIHLGPAVAPTWYPRVLRAWGRRRNVRVEFVLGPGFRLREGPEVEVALGRLYVRLLSAIFVACACLGLTGLLLFHGPHLSQSTANSVAVAGLPLLATVVAVLLLHGFFEPYRAPGGQPRVARTEDYVWPATRAVAWVAAGAGVLVPVVFAVLAAGPTYDAGKVFWEGLVCGPLAGSALVVAVERWLRHITDEADVTDPTLYVWDCLRTRAVQILLAVALGNLALGFNSALGGLNGVALVGPDPDWLDLSSTVCWVLQLLASVGCLMAIVQPVAPRLRARLWPGLPPTEPIEFGQALPIP